MFRRSQKKGFKKRNANKETQILIPLLLKLIQPPIKQGLKALQKTSPGSHITTITKNAIILKPILSPRRTIFQKLVTVLVTSILVTEASKKVVLQRIFYIWYPVKFQ